MCLFFSSDSIWRQGSHVCSVNPITRTLSMALISQRCMQRKAPTQTQTQRSMHLYINTGEWSLLHVPSTFATVNTHASVFFVFLPGGISKEWRHIVSANCDFEGETSPIVPMFTGLSGTAKIAHESHNDVRRLCWRHLRSAGRTWPAKAP